MEEARGLVVVGGGVAGLAGARRARREAERKGLALRITLLEAEPRLGGKVWTERADDGALLEWGPDALVASKPRGRDLLEELGLSEDAVAPATGRAYVLVGGRLRLLPRGTAMGIPTGVGALLDAVRTGILPPDAAARAALEPLLPPSRRRRSLGETVRRRFGRRVADRLVEPMAAGVFGAPGGDVPPEAVLPGETGGRSLMGAARRRPPVSFLGLRTGMGRLVDRLVEELAGADLRPGVRAGSIEAVDRGFVVGTAAGPVRADAVLVAVPGPAASDLLAGLSPSAGPWPTSWSSAVVHLRYAPGALRRPLDGAGYLVPGEDRGAVAACSWVSAKWPDRGSLGPHLRTVAIEPAARTLQDDRLLARTVDEVGRVMGATGPPREARLRRWPHALPRIPPGHHEQVRRVRASLPPGVEVAGAWYDGIGVPDCVRSGEEAAARLVAVLR